MFLLFVVHSRVWAQARFACLSSDWATTTGRLLGPTICLPHKDGDIPLSALPKDTTSELAGLFSTLSLMCWAPSREAVNTIFKVFWYDSTREMNPRSTDCEADALTTTPSRRLQEDPWHNEVQNEGNKQLSKIDHLHRNSEYPNILIGSLCSYIAVVGLHDVVLLSKQNDLILPVLKHTPKQNFVADRNN